jgi:hypothetical protein
MNVKIGILNCQHIDNYGAVLVAFSLQKALEDMGHKVVVLNYRPQYGNETVAVSEKKNLQYYLTKIKKNGIVTILKRKYKMKKYSAHKALKYLDHDKYESWREKYLYLSDKMYDEDSIIEGYDIIIEGSDVVWKPQRILGKEKNVFMLKNVSNDTYCMTYAASIGTDDAAELDRIRGIMLQYLKKYNKISIREKTSQKFISECARKPVEVCIDPTMLLDRTVYEKMASPYDGEPYIFMYTMGINEEAIKFVNWVSKKLDCGVIHPNLYYVNKKVRRTIKTYEEADPSDFLSYVKNAKLVVTNSFHGTVFSLIFHTPFYTFGRGEINIRMTDLLKQFEIGNRFLDKAYHLENNFAEIDFFKTDKIMERERQKGLEYLRRSINEACK